MSTDVPYMCKGDPTNLSNCQDNCKDRRDIVDNSHQVSRAEDCHTLTADIQVSNSQTLHTNEIPIKKKILAYTRKKSKYSD